MLYLRKNISVRIYLFMCIIYLVVGTLGMSPAHETAGEPYRYEYGPAVYEPWISFHQQEDVGKQPIWYHIINGNMGVSFSPAEPLWQCFFLYLALVLLKQYLKDRNNDLRRISDIRPQK